MQKTILITGATSGFGEATARLFAENNWRLILTGRRVERLERLKKEFSRVPVYIAAFDVSKRDEVEKFSKELPEEFSKIDVLVNNAGLGLGSESASEADLDQWQVMVDTNINGLMYMTRSFLPQMVERKSGHIVNIGSIAGSWPYPGGNAYGATKAFVAQFSRNLRSDVHGTGVRVTNIEPGIAETEFSLVRFSGDEKRAETVYEDASVLSAEDIAETIIWSVNRPARVNINSIEVMPTIQSWAQLNIHR